LQAPGLCSIIPGVNRRSFLLRAAGLLLAAVAALPAGGAGAPARVPAAPGVRPAVDWRTLEPGLELASVRLPGEPAGGAFAVNLLRVDPWRFELRLLCARAEPGHRARTPCQWCRERGALAAINAGMFMTDGLTACGLMRTAGHVNNPVLGSGRAVFVADPTDPALPPAQILETDLPAFRGLLSRYRTAAQNIRIVASQPAPHGVWLDRSGSWSEAAVGQDAQGRIVFLFSAALRNPAQLAAGLLRLPLGLRSLMHAEGGPSASLCVRAGGVEREWAGSAGSGQGDADEPAPAQPVPNVLAIYRRR